LDNWKEERFTEVTAILYQDLAVKEEALKKIWVTIQETNKSPSIATGKASTMTESSMVNSPSKTFLKRLSMTLKTTLEA
jgi:hypothetical protein